ncbi:MAG: NADH-quinone oxidoreductase subunit NuoE [Vampirovibrionia bacterium]
MKTIEVNKEVKEVVKKHGTQREHLLPILQDLVAAKSYLTEEIIRDVAIEMNISPNEIYSVATFYSFINTKPTGKYAIRICQTISCDLAGKEEIIKALEKELRVKVGYTTDDRMFSLETTACIGMCDQGPAMLINDDVYTKLTPKKAVEIIKEYKSKK